MRCSAYEGCQQVCGFPSGIFVSESDSAERNEVERSRARKRLDTALHGASVATEVRVRCPF
jgi:hypothetical protein